MVPSLERDNNVFGKQPDVSSLTPQLEELLGIFGGKVEKLTSKVLSPTERAILDNRLLTLEMQLAQLDKKHHKDIYSFMEGTA